MSEEHGCIDCRGCIRVNCDGIADTTPFALSGPVFMHVTESQIRLMNES